MDPKETKKKSTMSDRFSQFQNKEEYLSTPNPKLCKQSGDVTNKTDIEKTLADLLLTVSDTKTPKKRDEKAVVTLLSTPGIDVNAKDSYGNSPLVYSCAKNNTQSVKLLLAAPDIDVNFRDPFGRTPVMIALLYQSKETLQLLLNDSRVDIEENIKSDCGRTLEDWANQTGDETEEYLEMIKNARIEREKEIDPVASLESSRETPNIQLEEDKTPLIQKLKPDVTTELKLEATTELMSDAPTKLSLIKSKAKSSLAVVRSKFSEIADGFVDGFICPECKTEKFAVASLLAEHLTQHFATPRREKNIFDLIEKVSSTAEGYYGDKDDLKELLATPGINVNVTDTYGNSPLIYCCSKNDTESAKLLLSSPRIDVNLRDNYGRTPIMIALLYQSEDMLHLLLNDDRVDITEDVASDCGRTLEDWVNQTEEKEIYAEMIKKTRTEREMEARIRIQTESLKLSKVNVNLGEQLLNSLKIKLSEVKAKAKLGVDLVGNKCEELAKAVICPKCHTERFTLRALLAQHLAKHNN